MRLGALMVGGLLGAAAVLYVQRHNSKPMVFSLMNSASEGIDKVVGQAKQAARDIGLTAMMPNKSGTQQSQSQQGTTTATVSTGANGGTLQANITTNIPGGASGMTGANAQSTSAEQLIANDPALKAEFNEVMAAEANNANTAFSDASSTYKV